MRTVTSTLVLSIVVVGCGGSAVSTAPASPSSGASASVSPAPAAVDLSAVPTACIGLGPADCRRVVAETAPLLPPGTAVRYIQVGHFACAAGADCPPTLAARPEGDITLEAGDGALAYHVRLTGGDGRLAIDRQDAFGISLPPSSTPPVPLGPQAYTLGHCGLGSGIDLGGSWWDPVGQVDGDHADAINAAEGTINVLSPDHATFSSRGGLTVQLQRRQGNKYLPLCD
jgi:hypothetical protein